jgi:plastocyanin
MNLKRKLQRLFLISLAGWSFGDGAARAATVFDVSIGDNFFLPSSVTVFAGDQVKWTWVGVNSHSTTSDAGLWDSGVGGNGMTYARTFSSAGSFPYHCTIHSFQLGSVTVNAGGPAVTIVNPANGAVFSAPARFTLTATTTDPNGAVTNVAFLRGATVLANETHAPYSVVVSNLATTE